MMGKRPAPRRRPAPYEGEEPRPGFSLGALTNLGAIPILTAIFTVGGFYYITNSTLTRHTADIDQIRVGCATQNEYSSCGYSFSFSNNVWPSRTPTIWAMISAGILKPSTSWSGSIARQ